MRDMFPDWSECMKQNRITWNTNVINVATTSGAHNIDQGVDTVVRQHDPRSDCTLTGRENETEMEQDPVIEYSESLIEYSESRDHGILKAGQIKGDQPPDPFQI